MRGKHELWMENRLTAAQTHTGTGDGSLAVTHLLIPILVVGGWRVAGPINLPTGIHKIGEGMPPDDHPCSRCRCRRCPEQGNKIE